VISFFFFCHNKRDTKYNMITRAMICCII
jgi:hypothetical protein